MIMNEISLVECPRDAMQGWKKFIPAEDKIRYINSLLEVGFHTIDFGSFVSPKAIPQMADTRQVYEGIAGTETITELLAIVANARGAEEAAGFEKISYLGFPFSLSPTFQQRNTNSSMEESMDRIKFIQEICTKTGKTLVVYLSMGFGNPYGDEYNEEILLSWAEQMVQNKISIISLADTVGLATPDQISFALNTLIPKYPGTVFGVHLHSSPFNFEKKLEAAIQSGCKRVDGALKGIGGCPMAQDDLVGNMSMENIIFYMQERKLINNINNDALNTSLSMASQIFS